MQRLDRSNAWLSLVANLAILVGLILVVLELNQNTEHTRLLLMDQITARMKENNRALLGENPTAAIEKSIREPENMNFESFDPSFVAHVKEIMSKSESESRRGD